MKKENNLIQVSEGWSSSKAFKSRIYNNRILERFFAILFLLAGIYAIVNILIAGYFEGINAVGVIKIVAPAAVVFLVVLDLRNSFRFPILIIAILIASYEVYTNFKLLSDICQCTYYFISKWIVWYVTGGSVESPKNIYYITRHYSEYMVAIAAMPWAVLMSIAWSRRGHSYCAISAMSAYMALFFCCGFMPDFLPLLLLLVSGIGVCFKKPYKKKIEAYNNRTYLRNIRREFSFLLILLIAFLSYEMVYQKVTKVILPIQDYIYNGYSLEKVIVNGEPGAEADTAGGGISGGQTGKGGTSFNPGGKVAFEITSTENISHSIYLKGYVADTYDGQGWINKYSPLEMESFYLNDPYDAIANEYYNVRGILTMVSPKLTNQLWGEQANITIYSVGDDLANDGYILIPYAAMVDNTDGIIQNGYYLKRREGQSNYNQFSVYEPLGGYSLTNKDSFFTAYEWKIDGNSDILEGNVLASRKTNELEQMAYKQYTSVPDNLSRIKDQYSQYNFETVAEAVDFVKKELTYGFVYDTNPKEVPKGKDFIEYFLYESKRGYCMYFASAAVMIFRSMGIPARYVEGYMVTELNAQETKTIKDTNAHAWAEIFVSGYGWIPVEVTNARLTSDGFVGNPLQTRPAETTAANNTTKASTTARETTSGDGTAKPSGNSNTTTAADYGKIGGNPILKVVLIIVLCLLGLAILCFAYSGLFYLVYGGKIMRSLAGDNRNRILRTYGRIYHLTKSSSPLTAEGDMGMLAEFWELGEEKLEILKEALQAAEYGKRDISLEECQLAEKIEEKILMRKNKRAKGIGKLITLRKLRIRRKIYAGK